MFNRLRHRAESLPYRDDSFDLVVCLGLLEHLPAESRSRTLAELARVLRPSGRLALVLNNASSRFLGDPNDNPYRVGLQRENGYFCAVVNERALLDEASAWFACEPLGSNAFYSLQRHAARLLPDAARASDRVGDFFAAAARWDVALRPLDGAARDSADHHLYLLRRA